MLFKSLIRRLNGGTDTASTKVSSSYRRSSHLAYQLYPNLQDLLLRLLSVDGQSRSCDVEESINCRKPSPTMKAQSVFAALEVIEQSGLPPAHEADVRKALWLYAGSSDWALREKAAKALGLVVDDHDIEEEVASLLLAPTESQNELHGRLLCLRSFLSRNRAPLIGEELRK